ncbi:MAG: hypothetical protein AB7C91_09620 [Sphaerochaeta sp.]|jgi:hypothetical protein|uniref:hypothetical protein n=1 Tax=Sphaerochaeta sp. TaxID=1972642 RepID=UPI002FC89B14
MHTAWRKDQQELTRQIISRVDIIAFSISLIGRNKGCYLDHLDGRFGYITLEDALANRYRVFNYETDELEGTYESLDALIEAGWKVST